jgi:hypothetical protein
MRTTLLAAALVLACATDAQATLYEATWTGYNGEVATFTYDPALL